MIKSYITKFKRKNTTYALKGYKKLIQKKQLNTIRSKHNAMHNTPINSISFKPLFLNFSQNYISKEIILRQYLIQFLIRKFNFHYLMKLGGKKIIFFTAPVEWLNETLKNQNLLLRILSVISFFLYGCYRVFKSLNLFYFIILNNFIKKKNYLNNHNIAFFFNLNDTCIPTDSYTNNIINWYSNWEKRLDNLKYISSELVFNKNHKVNKLIYSRSMHPKYFIGSKYEVFKFIIFFILDFLLSIGYLFLGNPGNAIMLPELVIYRCFKLFGVQAIAGHYLFHYTWTIYRPLWTYIAEERGSRITLFFTSLTATIKSPYGENNNSFDYYPSTWPEYAVWSENHKKEISKYCLSKPKIFVENYIPFVVYKEKFIKLPKKSILIFDSEPQKLNEYLKTTGFATHDEYVYYNKRVLQKFFYDILELAKKNGFNIFHKRKRVLTYAADTSYKLLISNLEKNKIFNSLHPHTNIDNLIKQGTIIIGSPFTSIPYLARKINKPSIYYDPINYISKDDSNRNDVKVVNNYNELSKWLKEQYQ